MSHEVLKDLPSWQPPSLKFAEITSVRLSVDNG